MTGLQDEPRLGRREAGHQFGYALVAGLIIVLILGAAGYFWMEKTATKPIAQTAPLPMGAAEQTYASKIDFGSFELSRTTNFLNQQVTIVAGVVSNNGPQTVVEMEISMEFHDLSQNVILREKQRMFGTKEKPLLSLEKRPFQLNFETIPDGWNQVPPTFTITGLRLQ